MSVKSIGIVSVCIATVAKVFLKMRQCNPLGLNGKIIRRNPLKAKLFCGARIINGKPTWYVDVIARKHGGVHQRWRGSGYSTRHGAIRQGRRVALALAWTVVGFIEGMEP